MKHDLKELLDTIDMEAWFDAEGIDYRIGRGHNGTQLNVRECPACGSSSWKVYINADSGLGNCFAGDCGVKTFNKFSFMREYIDAANTHEVINYVKTVAREIGGWRAKKITPVEVELSELVLPESIPLPHKGKYLNYLAHRGIPPELAQFFHLRYSHTGYFEYQLCDGPRRQDYSRRVIIPIFDLDGHLASFQGRDITGEAERKYLFPPGYASTGKLLYNAQSVRGAEQLVINEGAFDVIATKLALDEDMALRDIGVVGTFGKHLSSGDPNGDDQLAMFIRLKNEGLEEVVIMWDSEIAALKDAAGAAKLLTGVGLSVRIALLPAGKDPNEVPAQAVRDAFYQALPATRSNITRMLLKADVKR